MESDRPDRDAALPPAGTPSGRTEWRALTRLRERVDAAAREIERLRDENAALAARLATLDEGAAPGLPLAPGESADEMRARVEAFIASLDRVLAASEPADADASDDAPEP